MNQCQSATERREYKKQFIIRAVITAICCVLLYLVVYNDFDYYDRTIAKVEVVTESSETASTSADSDFSGSRAGKSAKATQTLTVVIKNGNEKGSSLEITNQYEKSLVYDNKYREGDFVFLSDAHDKVMGAKRDHVIAGVFLLLIGLLIIFGKVQGSLTAVSVVINLFLMTLLVNLYLSGWDILGLAVVFCILFAFVVLLFICGFSKQTLISFSATIGATAVVGLIAFVLIWTAKDIGYEFLDFLPQPYTKWEGNHFFLAQVLMGALGAIMDVAVTITACASEILRKTPKIGVKALIDSVKEVADDITGAMINVVFFTNISVTIPVFIISMANDIRFSTVIRHNAYFDIARFLTGSIGILIAIPFSIFACKLFMKVKAK